LKKKTLKYKNTIDLSLKRLEAQKSGDNDLHRQIVDEQKKHIDKQK
jgi:hypothetical protein